MSIGNRISELRKQHNYSQEYIAEQLDISRQAVSKWEQDQTSPDTDNLIALARLLGVSVEYLATGKEVEGRQYNENKNTDSNINGKIIGYILLACGLLSLISGVLFSVTLIIISVYFLVGAFILLLFKKPSVLITVWVYFLMISVTLSMISGFNPFVFFNPETYSNILNGEVNMNIIMSFLMWVLLTVLSILSVIKIVGCVRKRK